MSKAHFRCPNLHAPPLQVVSTRARHEEPQEPSSRPKLSFLYKILQTNFHEKALLVKADVAAPFVVERYGSVSFALCFHPHSWRAHSSMTRCTMRSYFSDYREGAAIFGSVSSAPRREEGADQVRFAQSPYARDPKRIRTEGAVPLALGPLLRDHHLPPLFFGFASSIRRPGLLSCGSFAMVRRPLP
jgi:hypothetical protein